MSNTVPFPNIEAAQESASRWLAAIDRGLTEQEQNDLDTWLSESPLNGETLVAYAASWDKMDMLSAVSKILPLETVDIPATHTHEKAQSPNRIWLGSSIAAAVLVMAYFVSIPFLDNEAQPKPYFSAVYETVVGSQKEVTLPDGSFLKLNTDTELHIAFSEEAREIRLLRGEAYFEVAKNPERPFVALVNNDSVTAVGTAFNIQRIGQDDFEVLVTEGQVRVDEDIQLNSDTDTQKSPLPKKQLSLKVGGRVRISQNATQNKIETLAQENIDSDLAWRNGLIVFEGQTLEQVIAEISRYTAVNIDIADPSIKNIEVGGFFKAGDTDQLLYVLHQNFGIGYQQKGNTILLSALKNQ